MLNDVENSTPPFQCVFEVDHANGLLLTELAEGMSVEDIKKCTECTFQVG